MKNKSFIKILKVTKTIACFFILCSLLSSCEGEQLTENERTSENRQEVEIYFDSEARETVTINNKDELAELLLVDFSGLEIIQIIPSEFSIIIFCEGADDALDNVLGDNGFFERPLIEILLPAINIGLTGDNVQRFATKSRRRDYVSNLDCGWSTEWYQLDRNHRNEGNILLCANFPYRIEVDVDNILAEQERG
jgi:hypothetical protein